MVEPTLRSVQIALLDPHPDNPRIGFREDVVESIRQQIAEEGGFNPAHAIIVRAQGERFQVVCGHQRMEAAKRAGLAEVPAWVQEMDDDEAFMQLVLGNLQGELSPLELGLHALAARGRKGQRGQGVADYARRVGKAQQTISDQAMAAEVWKDTEKEYRMSGILSTSNCLSVSILAAIHAAPAAAWPAFVAAATAQGWTVEATRAAVAHLKATLAARPAWLPEPDAASLVGDATLADALLRAYEAATDADAALPEAAYTWVYQDCGERKAVDGRTYRVMRPVADTKVAVRSAFQAAVLALPDLTATAVRQAQKDAYRSPEGRLATADAPPERLEEEGWKYPFMAKWSQQNRASAESAMDALPATDRGAVEVIACKAMTPENQSVAMIVRLSAMSRDRRHGIFELSSSQDPYLQECGRRIALGVPVLPDRILGWIAEAMKALKCIADAVDDSSVRKAMAAVEALRSLDRKVAERYGDETSTKQ